MDDTTNDKAHAAKDKMVKPETEAAVRDAADAIKQSATKAKTAAGLKADEARAAAADVTHEVTGEARSQFEGAKAQARSTAEELRGTAQQRAEQEVRARQTQATGALSQAAQDFRRASDAVEETWLTKALSVVASQIEDVTRSIENKSPQELQSVARNAARNHPGLFLAGCFAAGVAVTRTLKAAANEQSGHLYDDGSSGGYAGSGTYGDTYASRSGGYDDTYAPRDVPAAGMTATDDIGDADAGFAGTRANDPNDPTLPTDLGRQ